MSKWCVFTKFYPAQVGGLGGRQGRWVVSVPAKLEPKPGLIVEVHRKDKDPQSVELTRLVFEDVGATVFPSNKDRSFWDFRPVPQSTDSSALVRTGSP